MDLKSGLTAAVGVMLTASLAYGLHPKLSLEEIAQNADLIFVGTVTRQNSHYNARRTAIETDVTFSDVRIEHATERAKQRGANTIRLTYGGVTVVPSAGRARTRRVRSRWAQPHPRAARS